MQLLVLNLFKSRRLLSHYLHCTYNLASVYTLQFVNPVCHTILNLAKRIFVVSVNVVYFRTRLSLNMIISLAIFLIGLLLYCYTKAKNSNVLKRMSKIQVSVYGTIISLIIIVLFGYTSYSVMPPERLLTIKTAWIFAKPVPAQVTQNIAELHSRHPNIPVHVYCGSPQCLNEIANLYRPKITAELLDITNIVSNTPMDDWLALHVMNKIVAGEMFEDHLQEVVRLASLSHYSGLHYDPRLTIYNLSFPTLEKS